MKLLFELKSYRQQLGLAIWDETRQQYDTSKCKTLEVTILVHYDYTSGDKAIIKVIRGGVTGYESYYVSDLIRDYPFKYEKGFPWCAGTPGRWDYLYTKADEMNSMFAVIKQLQLPNK
jgi:hypothetical protein